MILSTIRRCQRPFLRNPGGPEDLTWLGANVVETEGRVVEELDVVATVEIVGWPDWDGGGPPLNKTRDATSKATTTADIRSSLGAG